MKITQCTEKRTDTKRLTFKLEAGICNDGEREREDERRIWREETRRRKVLSASLADGSRSAPRGVLRSVAWQTAWRTAWLETLATDQRASAYFAEEEEAVGHGRMSKGKP